MTPNLDLAPIGNCSVSALIDRQGRFVWACAPRIDGDPVFSALMDGASPEHGFWAIEMEDVKTIDQAYVRNTAVLRTVLSLPEDRAQAALADLEEAVRRLPADDELGSVLNYVARSHPGDRGLLVALCMNHFVLEPGESMFTPAGQVHAYLQGTAVEIMACSDNVLRAGLTPKHVDVDELLRVVTDDQDPGVPQEAVTGPDGLRRISLWEDRLSLVSEEARPGRELELDPSTCTVLCVDGSVTLSSPGAEPVEVGAGHSAWVRADGEPVVVSGQGTFWAVELRA